MQVEQEEEYITNKLMKRLQQLKDEKQTLANEVEHEEEYLVNTLQKRLQKLNGEKVDLENQLVSGFGKLATRGGGGGAIVSMSAPIWMVCLISFPHYSQRWLVFGPWGVASRRLASLCTLPCQEFTKKCAVGHQFDSMAAVEAFPCGVGRLLKGHLAQGVGSAAEYPPGVSVSDFLA